MEIIPVDITLSVIFTHPFDIEKIYELIPCVKIVDYLFDGRKIPFFGLNDIVIGVKTEPWGSRGIRCLNGHNENDSAMKNCISLDFQYINSNFNIKIYQKLFHIGGLPSNAVGVNVANKLIETLSILNAIWTPFFRLNGEQRYNFINEFLFPIIFSEGKLRTINDPFIDISFNKVKNKIGELVDALRIFISFIEWYTIPELYISKIHKILSFNLVGDNILTNGMPIIIREIINLEGIYIGKIPHFDILLGFITNKLLAMKIDTSFLNEKGRSLKICTLTGLESFKIKKTNSMVPMHKIVIQDSGNVRVTSPGNPDLVIHESLRIMNIVSQLILAPDYPDMSQENITARILNIVANHLQIDPSKFSPTGVSEFHSEQTV
jgi:hypothetical protein